MPPSPSEPPTNQPSPPATTAQTAPPPVRPKASWRVKVLMLVISMVPCLAVLEVWARLAGGGQVRMPVSAMRTDTAFSYMFQPNLDMEAPVAGEQPFRLTTNERGFRGPTLDSIKDRPFRVVAIGDSFTAGWGIPEDRRALSLSFDAYAKAHPERGLGFATIACGGWSPDDYLYAYQSEVLSQPPDLVVIGVFPGNDILPADYAHSLTPWRKATEQLAHNRSPWWQPRLPGYLKSQLSGSLLMTRLAVRLGKTPEGFRRFEKDPALQRKEWETTFFYLDALVKAARASGAEVVLVCYPSTVQVFVPETIDGSGLDHTMPEKTLGEFCRERSVPFIALLDDLKAAKRTDLFFKLDRHLTVAGHAVAAETLNKQLWPMIDETWTKKQRERRSE